MNDADPVTSAAAGLAAARQAHAQAIANHTTALDAAARAKDRHTGAAGQRQQLLAAAADGTPVDEAALQRATTATRSAEDVLDLHRSICVGARTRVQEAEIAVLHCEVAHHGTRTHAARLAAVEAAAAVDAAIDEARAKLAAYQATLVALRNLHDESVQFNNGTLTAALAANPVLSARHPSEHPKMRSVPVVRDALAIMIVLNATAIGGGYLGEETRALQSLAHHAASIAPATPATKAA